MSSASPIALTVFAVVGLAGLVGAIGVVAARNVVHAALALILALAAVAAVYVLLYAEFLALVQVLIYGGAVTIVLLFALMLTRMRESTLVYDNAQRPVAVVTALALFGVMVAAILSVRWPAAPNPDIESIGFAQLGRSLFVDWGIPFEIASLVLLVALLGAIIIARREDQE